MVKDDWVEGERKEVMESLEVVLRNIKIGGLMDLANVVDREDGSFAPDLTLRVLDELEKRKAKRK